MSPDTRKHRGPHPNDHNLFGADAIPALRSAVTDLSELLTRGYPMDASLKLVGDRYRLRQRQCMAVRRSACSRQAMENRHQGCLKESDVKGKTILVDAFNVLITLESALSSGYLFLGRDGCIRDLASVHGSYRKVTETIQAIDLMGKCLQSWKSREVIWVLDRPVSNSGRLARILDKAAEENHWPWRSELAMNPDKILIARREITCTSDSAILDAAIPWINPLPDLIRAAIPSSRMVDLSSDAA